MKNKMTDIIGKTGKNHYLIWTIRVLMAMTVVFAINARVDVIEEIHPYNTIWGCIAMQFAYAFNQTGLGDFLELITVLMAFKYFADKRISHNIPTLVVSGVLSLTYLLCVSFREYDDMTLLTSGVFHKVFTIYQLIGLTILIYFSLLICYYCADRCIEKVSNCDGVENTANDSMSIAKGLWIKSAIAIGISYLLWVVANYPGSFNPDSIEQLQQFLGIHSWSAHHPPFSSMIMGACVAMGRLLGSGNLGVFLYALLNIITATALFSYIVKKVYEWSESSKASYITVVFFCIVPTWGSRIQWIEKSFLYAAGSAFVAVVLIDTVIKGEITSKKLVIVGLVSLFSCLIRNDGLYLIVPTLLILVFIAQKDMKIKMAVVLAVVVLITKIVTGVIYPNLGISKGSVAEALSLPFMQTARYIVAFENDVTDEERQAIDSVLVYDELANRYNPILSDPVKGLYRGDNSKLPEYFKVWAKMFLKHPNVYVSAFINKSYGYLAPVEGSADANYDYEEDEFLTELGVYHVKKDIPKKMFNGAYVGATMWPIFKYTTMAGAYTWIQIACLVYALLRRKWKYVLCYVPAIMNLLICIASPCHNLLRYYIGMAIVTPAFIVSAIYSGEKYE